MPTQLETTGRLALLAQRVEEWNCFRREQSEFIVLNRVSLPDAELAGIDLHCVLLNEADLRRADLSSASLYRSLLRKSDLRGSDLRSANLDQADLCRADLSSADLRGASLVSAFLKRTDLTGADLSTARGLTLKQLSDAYGDEQTKLPEGMERPAVWSTSPRVSRGTE